MKTFFSLFVFLTLPALLPAQTWSVHYLVKALDVRLYNPAYNGSQLVNGREYEIQLKPNPGSLITNMGPSPFTVSVRVEHPGYYLQGNLTAYEESFWVSIEPPWQDSFDEFFRLYGLEYSLSAGRNVYDKKGKTSFLASLILRHTYRPLEPDVLPIGGIFLPDDDFDVIYGQIQSFKRVQPFWSVSLERNALKSVFITLAAGGNIGHAGKAYGSTYFLSAGLRYKGILLSPHRGKKRF